MKKKNTELSKKKKIVFFSILIFILNSLIIYAENSKSFKALVENEFNFSFLLWGSLYLKLLDIYETWSVIKSEILKYLTVDIDSCSLNFST